MNRSDYEEIYNESRADFAEENDFMSAERAEAEAIGERWP